MRPCRGARIILPATPPSRAMAPMMAYAVPMMMVPVMIPVRRCHTHEGVEEIVERTVVVPDKRIRMQPVKRVKYVKTGKYVK